MDPVTGNSWRKLTSSFELNYQDSNSAYRNWVRRESWPYDNRLFLTGSAIEGGMFCGLEFGREGDGIDVDVMVDYLNCSLSIEDQIEIIREIDNHPGYATLDITNHNIEVLKHLVKKQDGRTYVSATLFRRHALEQLKTHRPTEFKIDENIDVSSGTPSIRILLMKKEKMGGDRTKKEEMGGDITKKEKMRGDRTSTNKQDKKYQVVHKGLEEDKEDTKQCQIQYDNPLYTDFVPAISCEFWPYPLAEEWIYRKRHWPPRIVVCQIVLDGYNTVPKASPDGNKDLEWRFSFSKAEGTLAQCRTNFQHRCFYIFKTIIKETAAEFEVVTTYILKTIMMWAMEQKLPTLWEGENLGKCVYGLFDDLLHALAISKLPHYFIPQNNLLSHISKDSLIKEAQRISKILNSALLLNRHESKGGLINDVMKTLFGRISEQILVNYHGFPTIISEKEESDFTPQQSKSAAKQGKGLESVLNIIFSVTKHVLAAQSIKCWEDRQ